jgi:hypothetical protein
MVGKMTLTAALMLGTAALAQQTQNPTAPSNPTAPHTNPVPNLTECWDIATNQVRPRETVGSVRSNRGPDPPPQNQRPPSGFEPKRPAGMQNC